jgi:hypothetical protein
MYGGADGRPAPNQTLDDGDFVYVTHAFRAACMADPDQRKVDIRLREPRVAARRRTVDECHVGRGPAADQPRGHDSLDVLSTGTGRWKFICLVSKGCIGAAS